MTTTREALERAVKWCEEHGDTRRQWYCDAKKALSAANAEPDYEALERDHLGDAEKRTGIYHPDNISAANAAEAKQEVHDRADMLGTALLYMASCEELANSGASAKTIEIMRDAAKFIAALPSPVDAQPTDRNLVGETPTEHAHRWATELAVYMSKKFYPEVTQWQPLPDLLGVITQIDNMTTGLVRAQPTEQVEPDYCPNCGGTGEVTAMSDNSPDAHEVCIVCPHCEGHQTLEAAYRGVRKLLDAEHKKYLKACGEIWRMSISISAPAAEPLTQDDHPASGAVDEQSIVARILSLPRGTSGRIIIEQADEEWIRAALSPNQVNAAQTEKDAEDAKLYRALREMRWFHKKLCVVKSRDVLPGIQAYSLENLDEAIREHSSQSPSA